MLYIAVIHVFKLVWKPDEARNFIPIQQDGQQCKKKNIFEVLSPIDQSPKHRQPHTILIEASIGTGKTLLLKKISFQWAICGLLKNCDMLFLLHLRDPLVQDMDSLSDFVHYFFEYDEDYKDLALQFASELQQDEGQSITLLLDSYHAFPNNLKENSFIAKILQRRVLPNCDIVLTSQHPCDASGKLNFIVSHWFKLEGSIKEYSIEEKQQEAETLYKHLETNSLLNCYYLRLYMNILLILHKERVFLLNFTDYYSKFICLSINRYLKKLEEKEAITDINKLQPPFSNIIKQLSKLAFERLIKDQSIAIFEDDLKKECPDLDVNKWGGLGLLYAMNHESPKKYQFLDYSVLEFLAAYHVSTLPSDMMVNLLQEQFWNQKYNHMFIFYVGLTKGRDPSFKRFLSDENDHVTIADKYLSDHSKSDYLYKCFKEIGDEEVCKIIESTYVSNYG